MTTTAFPIQASGLRRSLGSTQVLDGVDLRVPHGTLLALLGPNGAGKTTTVRILSTLLQPDSGTATVNGHDVVTEGAAVRRSIGLTGQYATLDDLLTGRENLVMMGRLRHLDRRAARRDAQNLLERFDLTEAADRPVRTYSGGMRRRLDLAASLLGGPPVLFLDEPTTGLDPRSRVSLWDTVRELLASGVTILLTTQYLEEADQLADRVALINGGRIAAEGTSDQLKRRIGTARLDLSFATEAERHHAARLLLPSEAARDTGETRLSVPVDGVDELGHLIGRLGHAGVRVADFEVSKPTLDDVFLSLTEDRASTGPAPVEARR